MKLLCYATMTLTRTRFRSTMKCDGSYSSPREHLPRTLQVDNLLDTTVTSTRQVVFRRVLVSPASLSRLTGYLSQGPTETAAPGRLSPAHPSRGRTRNMRPTAPHRHSVLHAAGSHRVGTAVRQGRSPRSHTADSPFRCILASLAAPSPSSGCVLVARY